MRFTATADIPVSELISSPEEVEAICTYFEAGDGPLGFDTETSGLEFDGLGVDVHVICMADQHRRVAILVSGEHQANMWRVAFMLDRTQHRHCGFNIIYDWNALYGYTRWKLNWKTPLQLHTCWADGMKLFLLFDEEAEDTQGQKGLKARARYWLGLPMNDFDKIVSKGGILDALAKEPARVVDYCTRDAWAHLGVCTLGKQIAETMPWCHTCPTCGSYCYEANKATDTVYCLTHGWVRGQDRKTMWDWHRERDIPLHHVLQKMQVRGLPTDWDYLGAAVSPLEIARTQALQQFNSEVSTALAVQTGGPVAFAINPRSDPQLRKLYHGTTDKNGNFGFGFPYTGRTESGGASMNDKSMRTLLVKYQAPGVLPLLKYKKLGKILTTYITGMQAQRFPATGRLHGAFRPWTTTGRLKSWSPNMQNFPVQDIEVMLPPAVPYLPTVEEMTEQGMTLDEAKEELARPEYASVPLRVNIRQAIRAPQGWKILCADYSQLEIRLTAMESGCSNLIKVLREGMDMHCYAAAQAFANAIPGMGYADIYEAKQWHEGARDARWLKLRELTDLSQTREICRLRTSKVPLNFDTHLAAAMGWQGVYESCAAELTDEEWLNMCRELHEGAMPNASYLAVLALLGLRDKELLNLRKAAKSAIFGIIYGIGPTKLAGQITEATGQPCQISEAKTLIESIKDVVFPGIGQMIARQERQLMSKGYVRTAMGRYRHPAGISSGDSGRVAKAKRISTNSPVQGVAADVVGEAMIAIDADPQLEEWGAVMVSQIHDEILTLCREEMVDLVLPRVKFLMETSHGLHVPVPLEVSIHAGDTWNEAK